MLTILLILAFFSRNIITQDEGLNPSPVNPRFIKSCLKRVCYNNVGCFDPWRLTSYLSSTIEAVCPQDPATLGVKFFILSALTPTILQLDPSTMICGSRVAFYIHGYTQSATDAYSLLAAVLLLRTFDYVILVDWRFPADPVIVAGTPIIGINALIMQADVAGIGRYVANFVYQSLIRDTDSPCIKPSDIEIIGFSAGGNMQYWIGDWLVNYYGIKINHIVALDPSGPSYYLTNYELFQIKPGLAETVSVFKCTFNFPIIGVTELQAASLRFGSFDTSGNCTYLINYPYSLVAQPDCGGIYGCSHFYCAIVHAASLLPNCKFKYKKCSYVGVISYGPETTSLDCPANGPNETICIEASSNPLSKCSLHNSQN